MIKDVLRVGTTFVPRSHQKSLYARPTSAAAVPSRRSALLFATVTFSYSAASAGVKNSFPAKLAGRSNGVSVTFVQTPCRSGLPSGVRGATYFAVLFAAGAAWPATGAGTAETAAMISAAVTARTLHVAAYRFLCE